MKFRTWNKASERFADASDELSLMGDGSVDFFCAEDGHINEPLEGSDWVVQQFTGFKDEDGNDIYDGDIFSNDCHEMPFMHIVWKAGS